MWRNFLTVALRNIRKNRVFALINISGLSIGLASSILILLFVFTELSYDRFHRNSDRIFRLYTDGVMGEQTFRIALTSMAMAPAFAEEIPEIEDFVRFDVFSQYMVQAEDAQYMEDHFMYADASIFEIFDFEFIRGEPATALSIPNALVITEEKARLYFGNQDPMGLPMRVNEDNFIVTGVVKSMPGNSHFFADFIASLAQRHDLDRETWFEISIYSYVLLAPGADWHRVEEKMALVMNQHIGTELESVLGLDRQQWTEGGNRYGLFLQPLKAIHLQPDIELGMETCFRPVNDKSYIYIFSLVAFFILVIASINFMNLSTARAAVRGREIGIRKAAGSTRRMLVWQFLSESVMLSLVALAFALILVELALPWFNRTMELNLSMGSPYNYYLVPMLILLALFIGLFSGSYPAVYLSRYRPVEAIKGHHKGGKHEGLFRKILVIFQFAISVAIIISTLVVSGQLRYMLSKELGFNQEQLIVLQRIYPLGNSIQTFCREVEKIPGVETASYSSTYLGFNSQTETYQIRGREASRNYMFAMNYVDHTFMETYQFSLEGGAGRFFDPKFVTDSSAVLINRTAAVEYGLPEPLNTVLLQPTLEGDTNELHVIGVMEDFHYSSLRESIGPYMVRLMPETADPGGLVTIRLGVAGEGLSRTLGNIRQTWLEMTEGAPFLFFFLDEELAKYYMEESRTGRISLMFAILATFIACLGLFGLTLHNTQRRIHEIGIRKAMGASIGELVTALSGEIIILMGISLFPAWVSAYFFMENWLQDFPYNIGFRPWIFLVAALAAMVISVLTVSILSFRAARTSPARTLHYE